MPRATNFLLYFVCFLFLPLSCNKTEKTAVQKSEIVQIAFDGQPRKIMINLIDYQSPFTILLEAGGGQDSKAWSTIQDSIAEATKMNVISYDRLGWGESELGPENLLPQDEMKILNDLLITLKMNTNLVLVGHSYGGLLIHLYSMLHPEAVKGMLLIDPMNTRFVEKFGLERLKATFPRIENPKTKMEKAMSRLQNQFSSVVEIMKGKELIKDIPVVLISVGSPPLDDTVEDINSWKTSHEEMVSFSNQHKLAYLKENTHNVVQENPKEIVKQLLFIVDSVR